MIEKLKSLLHLKRSNTYYAQRLGISEQEVAEMRAQIKNQYTSTVATTSNLISYAFEQNVNKEKGTINSTAETTFDPKTDEELAELHKIDLTKYKISSYWSKLKSNGKFTSSVFATLLKPEDYTPQDFANFLESYVPKLDIGAWGFSPDFDKTEVDVEISIADFHLAKKTLENESLADKKEQYLTAIRDLCKKVSSNYNIDKLVFPISNDFFHTDNYQNQTTNGTPQDVLVGFDKEYEYGFDLLVNAIYYLASQAQTVEIILVQGNHDRTKSFYLAHALEVYFKGNPKIKFQREHSTTKSVILGCTFIGYHHGNCKIDDLPLLFATGKDSLHFGFANYREVHTGDKHHYMAKEIKGVRIQQSPSLSGTDRWHEDNNFVHSVRAALGTVYDKQTGRIAEFESRIKL